MAGRASGRRRAAALFESVAALFLAAAIALTVADVCLRSIDVQWRIFGVVELVLLAFSCLVFLAMPAVFLAGENIAISLFDEAVPRRVLRFLVVAAGLGTIAYLALMDWQIVVSGLEALRFDDETMDLRIPLVLYWLPIWIGFGGALAAEAYLLLAGRFGAALEEGPDRRDAA